MDMMCTLVGTRYSSFVCIILNNVAKEDIYQPKELNYVFIMTDTRVVISRG